MAVTGGPSLSSGDGMSSNQRVPIRVFACWESVICSMIPPFILCVQIWNSSINDYLLNAKHTKDTKMRQDPKITSFI